MNFKLNLSAFLLLLNLLIACDFESSNTTKSDPEKIIEEFNEYRDLSATQCQTILGNIDEVKWLNEYDWVTRLRTYYLEYKLNSRSYQDFVSLCDSTNIRAVIDYDYLNVLKQDFTSEYLLALEEAEELRIKQERYRKKQLQALDRLIEQTSGLKEEDYQRSCSTSDAARELRAMGYTVLSVFNAEAKNAFKVNYISKSGNSIQATLILNNKKECSGALLYDKFLLN